MINQKDRIEAAIRHIQTSADIDPWAMELAISALKAQDATDTNVGSNGDTIYRQMAIDAIKKRADKARDMVGSDHPFWEGLIVALDIVEQLPSAQPERTCVNCGRTANNGGWYADGKTRCPIEEHYALPKDGYCHLWEKRNVTDDDYPERRTDE